MGEAKAKLVEFQKAQEGLPLGQIAVPPVIGAQAVIVDLCCNHLGSAAEVLIAQFKNKELADEVVKSIEYIQKAKMVFIHKSLNRVQIAAPSDVPQLVQP